MNFADELKRIGIDYVYELIESIRDQLQEKLGRFQESDKELLIPVITKIESVIERYKSRVDRLNNFEGDVDQMVKNFFVSTALNIALILLKIGETLGQVTDNTDRELVALLNEVKSAFIGMEEIEENL